MPNELERFILNSGHNIVDIHSLDYLGGHAKESINSSLGAGMPIRIDVEGDCRSHVKGVFYPLMADG